MTTGRINQVARPPATPDPRPRHPQPGRGGAQGRAGRHRVEAGERCPDDLGMGWGGGAPTRCMHRIRESSRRHERPVGTEGRGRTPARGARGPHGVRPPPRRRRRCGKGQNGTPKSPPRGGRPHGQLTGGGAAGRDRARVKGRTQRRQAASRQGDRRWLRIRDRSRADTVAAASRPTPIPRAWSLAARERTKEESSSGRRQRSTAEHETPERGNEPRGGGEPRSAHTDV